MALAHPPHPHNLTQGARPAPTPVPPAGSSPRPTDGPRPGLSRVDPHLFHPLPVIGHPEAWYAKHIAQAEQAGEQHARASYKVGLHVTQALVPGMPWEEKFRHFRHAIKHYCQPPEGAGEAIKVFYAKLAEVVRRYAGQEAVKVVRQQHEQYVRKLKSGVSRDEIANEAELFFPPFIGHGHGPPEWLSPDAWNQIRNIEANWV